MHELSIAINIVEIAVEAAAQHDGRVVGVHLNMGMLSGVAKEALVSAWELARRGSPLEQAALMIEEIPVAAYCPQCCVQRNIVSPQLLCCEHCDAAMAEIVRGRELEVVALELEE
jgi:hydrogenase nickel incorporation protein HypA/HybF